MKNLLFLITVTFTSLTFFSCGGSGISGTWKGYEIGGGVPPSNWYIDINGERINAIHSGAYGDKESYKGTIKETSKENGIINYKVFFDFGGGVGMDYILKYASTKDKFFGLSDNSSDEKFQAIMELDGINGGTIYLEK